VVGRRLVSRHVLHERNCAALNSVQGTVRLEQECRGGRGGIGSLLSRCFPEDTRIE